MEKIDGITAAYVDQDIELHYTSGASFDKDAVAEVLKPLKMVIKESKKIEKLPF